jgi:hypothetical protein
MTASALNAVILGPLLAGAVLFGIWAAIDIMRMRRYSKRIRAYDTNYHRAIIAHQAGDLTGPDFQWAVTKANEPIPDYHRTWPARTRP